MDKGCTIQELNRGPFLPRTQEDTFTITMEAIILMEGFRITIVAPRMGMGMEETTVRTVPTQQHPLMTHKYRGSIVVLSISKSVEPNEEQKEMISGFQQGILCKY